MQTTCLLKRWDHHTASGGYDRLATEVGANVIARKKIAGIVPLVAQKLWRDRTQTGSYLFDYQFGDLAAEIGALATGLLFPPDVLHVLYGDEQLDQLLRWRRLLRCRLVVTFHQPGHRIPHRFEVYQKGLGRGIDAAIVVSKFQVEPFETWIGANKVVYIPHGIDTDRFSPGCQVLDASVTRLVMVGGHLRDWEVTHRVIDQVNRLRLGVQFHIVTTTDNYAYFTGCANTVLHTGISEPELVDLYRTSDALFVPVLESTANNAVLEALACGTPVISNSVGGIPDYVNEESGWLLPKGEVDRVVELVKCLSTNKGFAESHRKAARIQALAFDWRVVARKVSAVYLAVCNGTPPSDAVKRLEHSRTYA
jgi:glycosyltransferase involved in cell wall biosynthesis